MKALASLNTILFFSVLILFTNCKRQSPAQKHSNILHEEIVIPSLGDTVSEMDKNLMLIYHDQQNNYWFGSKMQGVYKYDGSNIIHFTIKDGLSDNRIRSIQEDQSGILYFGTGKGISQFDGQAFKTLALIEEVKEKWQLKPDDLWFEGEWGGGGPYRYDGDSLYRLELPSHELEVAFYAKHPNVSFSPYDVYKIYKDNSGNIWFGTANFGACRFDGQSFIWISEKELIEFDEDRAPGVRSIMEDKDGYLWLSANVNHKYKILEDSKATQVKALQYEMLKGIDNSGESNMPPYFMAIAEDKNGAIWMATYSEGIWQYNGNNLSHHPIQLGDTPVLVFTIYKDRQGTLWLGTQNAGVWRYNGIQFVPFNPAIG